MTSASLVRRHNRIQQHQPTTHSSTSQTRTNNIPRLQPLNHLQPWLQVVRHDLCSECKFRISARFCQYSVPNLHATLNPDPLPRHTLRCSVPAGQLLQMISYRVLSLRRMFFDGSALVSSPRLTTSHRQSLRLSLDGLCPVLILHCTPEVLHSADVALVFISRTRLPSSSPMSEALGSLSSMSQVSLSMPLLQSFLPPALPAGALVTLLAHLPTHLSQVPNGQMSSR